MRLYNTLTRSVQEFSPLDGKTVRMYVCGPTVYDDPHIGHARSAYTFDVLRRFLLHKGYAVTFVRNVTDVDDKIIHKSQQTGQTPEAVAATYLKSYHDTLDRMGIGRPTHEPAATAHIDEMLNLISQLVLNGSAYETKDGDVYFAVRKFPGYGKLSNRAIDELQSSERSEHPAHGETGGGAGKQDPLDFALWKAAKPGEPSWKSPWGQGRPGWHIECSAMSTKYLGDEFDIHGGGVDLVFPHHENEVAQAQAAGKPFARYWVHNGLLTVDGEKMSKSLGNYTTVEEALKSCKGETDVLKMFFLSAHYRTPVDYSVSSLHAAAQRCDAIDSVLSRTHPDAFPPASGSPAGSGAMLPEVARFTAEFERAMDDDLNTPQAVAALDGLVGAANAALRQNGMAQANAAAAAILKLAPVLGLLGDRASVPEDVMQLVQQREDARKRKDFQAADGFRQAVADQGFIIEDSAKGPVVRRKR